MALTSSRLNVVITRNNTVVTMCFAAAVEGLRTAAEDTRGTSERDDVHRYGAAAAAHQGQATAAESG